MITSISQASLVAWHCRLSRLEPMRIGLRLEPRSDINSCCRSCIVCCAVLLFAVPKKCPPKKMQGTKASKARFSHLVSLSQLVILSFYEPFSELFRFSTSAATLIYSNTFQFCLSTRSVSGHLQLAVTTPFYDVPNPKKITFQSTMRNAGKKRRRLVLGSCKTLILDHNDLHEATKCRLCFFRRWGVRKFPLSTAYRAAEPVPKCCVGLVTPGTMRHHAAPCLKRNQTAPRVLRHMAQSCHPPHLKYLAVTRKMPIYDKLQRATKCSSELHSAFSASLEAL